MENRYWEKSFSNDSIGLEVQLDELGLSPEMLRDKAVLDLGSGGALFAEGIKDNYPDLNIKVVSLDPKYSNPEHLKRKVMPGEDATIERIGNKEILAVSAVAESLPFKDESFDIVISNCAVPYYQDDDRIKEASILEIIRVLKPGGEARITMVVDNDEKILRGVVDASSDCTLEYSDQLVIIKKSPKVDV